MDKLIESIIQACGEEFNAYPMLRIKIISLALAKMQEELEA